MGGSVARFPFKGMVFRAYGESRGSSGCRGSGDAGPEEQGVSQRIGRLWRPWRHGWEESKLAIEDAACELGGMKIRKSR